jgi:hypothetical protein
MRVKDLKDNYRVLEREGFYHLYDPEHGSGMRNVFKYLCSVKKISSTKFRLKGGKKSTSNFEEFQDMIEKKIKSYKYDSEYYDPNYRKGCFEEFVIRDYLEELGFEFSGSNFGYESFALKRPSIYGHQLTKVILTFKGLNTVRAYVGQEGFPKKVSISLSSGDWSSVNTKADRNVEDIKKAINSLVKPLMLTEGVENVKTSEKMEEVGNVDLLFKKLSVAAGMQTMDAKAHIKEKLISLAESL